VILVLKEFFININWMAIGEVTVMDMNSFLSNFAVNIRLTSPFVVFVDVCELVLNRVRECKCGKNKESDK